MKETTNKKQLEIMNKNVALARKCIGAAIKEDKKFLKELAKH